MNRIECLKKAEKTPHKDFVLLNPRLFVYPWRRLGQNQNFSFGIGDKLSPNASNSPNF